MKRAILVNPQAKRMRRNAHYRRQISRLFADQAFVIDVDGTDESLSNLEALHLQHQIEEIYIVGGDGTFNQVLNWSIRLDQAVRPAIVSVGGGEFCYMARHHGFSTSNPIKNLEAIFSGEIKLQRETWYPVQIREAATRAVRYASVIANGLVSDFLEWYEDKGKGNFFVVLQIIMIAILSVMADWIRRVHGRLKLANGKVDMDEFRVPHEEYVGVAASSIPELLSNCRPFHGAIDKTRFYAIGYWGSFRALAFAAPMIWFGRIAFWIKKTIRNTPTMELRIITNDPRLVLDGDLIHWNRSTSPNTEHYEFIITRGPAVTLLNVCP